MRINYLKKYIAKNIILKVYYTLKKHIKNIISLTFKTYMLVKIVKTAS